MSEIVGYKEGSHLRFERAGKTLVFDLKDLKFYRPLKGGELKEAKNAQSFFRHLSVYDVAGSFKHTAYGELMKLVKRGTGGRTTNFASVFENVNKYTHLESYLLLGIPFTGSHVFSKPASIYTKEVLTFMKECRLDFSNRYWEENYERYPELVTKLCTHVRRNHYLDLEVYRMLHSMISGGGFEKFVLLVGEQREPRMIEERRYYRNVRTLEETPYGCEYKTLFSYLVRIDRTEACSFSSALGYYRDYLKMMREIERNKAIARMVELNVPFELDNVGYVGFGRIEKYPKYLRTRHDIVVKNYNDWDLDTDDAIFACRVNRGFAYEWGKYKMFVPSKANDVKAEGATLHHCVASYVSRIMDGTTQIVFMREDKDESLVTVEIRANAIVQARGYNNRNLTDEEAKWLKTYAKAKNLNYKDVKRDENMPTPPVTALVKWNAEIATLRELSMWVNGKL